uniref:Uncharacterized protein n=1 Tax=Rhizophora mucronata TaxID=61149 RepID=A0A2P2NSY6_RHIMU
MSLCLPNELFSDLR